MKYIVLKGLDFRYQKYKEGDIVELPEGLANKLILDGEVDKAPKTTEAPTEAPKKDKKGK